MIMILSSITFFIGRFHPVIVHLPIGFILIAVFLDWRKTDTKPSSAISYAWLLSAISSGLAALMGWFLANESSYDNWTLFAHRWLGIIIGLLSLYAWYIRRDQQPTAMMRRITNIAAVVIIFITSHLGGNMTHGSDYLLVHAPTPIQKIFGYGEADKNYPQYTSPESVTVYADLIEPTLEQKCWSCHNPSNPNGGLILTTIEALNKGGDSGPAVIAGDVNSELVKRVTLPPSSSKFMPSSGTVMTYQEIKLLEWWIAEGADHTIRANQINATPSIKTTVRDLFGLKL